MRKTMIVMMEEINTKKKSQYLIIVKEIRSFVGVKTNGLLTLFKWNPVSLAN